MLCTARDERRLEKKSRERERKRAARANGCSPRRRNRKKKAFGATGMENLAGGALAVREVATTISIMDSLKCIQNLGSPRGNGTVSVRGAATDPFRS